MKIFIIDDEQENLYLTQRMLVLKGFSADKDIHTFQSAKKALNSLLECSEEDFPDLVILDLNMPKMDGWQFMDAIEALRPRLKGMCKIYILTSFPDSSEVKKARENPMVFGFMHKPVRTEVIRISNSPANITTSATKVSKEL